MQLQVKMKPLPLRKTKQTNEPDFKGYYLYYRYPHGKTLTELGFLPLKKGLDTKNIILCSWTIIK